MKPYHFDYEDGLSVQAEHREYEIRRFLSESLTDYLEARGRAVPGPVKRGELPALRKGPFGKPYFEGPGLEGVFFSLSHTRGHAIVCFSEAEIGADCENIKTRPEIVSKSVRLAKRCFTDDERVWVDFGEPDWHVRFFEIWTAKEAYMKYTGKGFAEGFRSFSVLQAPGVNIETGRISGAPHVVYSVCTGDGAAGAHA